MTTSPSLPDDFDPARPLDGRRAVVTGGGRGIGAATARALAALGAAVVVSARSRDQIDAVAGELSSAGHSARAVSCDVSDPDSIESLFEQASEPGPVDLLINNAGMAASSPIARQQLEEWDRIFSVNVRGLFLCTRAFLPAIVERGWGRVINVASVAGKIGSPYISAYTASKHAVVGFTRAVAAEVAKTGVTVNAVCPGYVETDMMAQSVNTIVGKTGMDPADARGHLEALSPQQRVFTAEEVAHQIGHLCHPLSGGVNGQCLVIDGGGVQV
ncbi:MAG: SDR family oxidoreductase [Thermoanaerobaculia bacterium]|nr:SDR family oxidoreductase [Thermoanaerobaculia bacterium]